MSKSKVIGNFILEQWVNGNYRKTWLRRITRETKTSYVSEVQRDVQNYDKGRDSYVFDGKLATRYRKTKDGGFRYIFTRRSNPDGKMNLSLITDPATLKCSYTFDELFNTDIREFQNPTNYPLKGILRANERNEERKEDFRESYLLKDYLETVEGLNMLEKNLWDAPILKYLEDTFKVPVYYYCSSHNISEHSIQSKLTQSATFFHITHFHGDKKVITFTENDLNRTIIFWLFEDKLVFNYL